MPPAALGHSRDPQQDLGQVLVCPQDGDKGRPDTGLALGTGVGGQCLVAGVGGRCLVAGVGAGLGGRCLVVSVGASVGGGRWGPARAAWGGHGRAGSVRKVLCVPMSYLTSYVFISSSVK